jgi:hypothetical protein
MDTHARGEPHLLMSSVCQIDSLLAQEAHLSQRYFPVCGNHDSIDQIGEYFGSLFRWTNDSDRAAPHFKKYSAGKQNVLLPDVSHLDVAHFPSAYSFRLRALLTFPYLTRSEPMHYPYLVTPAMLA